MSICIRKVLFESVIILYLLFVLLLRKLLRVSPRRPHIGSCRRHDTGMATWYGRERPRQGEREAYVGNELVVLPKYYSIDINLQIKSIVSNNR